MKKLIIAAVLMAFGAGQALAADIPPRPAPPPYRPPPPVEVPFSWTGFYVGLHGGGDWFRKDWFVPNTPTNVAGGCAVPGCNYSVGGHTATSWLAGGQIGFNYQINWIVLGAEVQGSWTDIKGTNLDPAPVDPAIGFANHTRTDAVATAAARLGLAVDRTLFFVKGGAAYADDKFWVTTNTNPIALQSKWFNRWGWMVGGGLEYGLTQNWSVKVEYDYLDFGTKRETLPCAASAVGCGGPFDYDIKQRIQLVKAGINYRFGGPVSARY